MGASTSMPAMKDYTWLVPDSEDLENHLGAIHRNPVDNKSPDSYKFYYEDGVTLYDLFQRGLKISENLPCMGYRPIDAAGKAGPFVWLTYKECWAKSRAIGSAMRNMDLAPPSEDEEPMRMVGLFTKNRYEWVIVEQACNGYSGVVVPLYDTLGESAVTYVLNQTGLTTVFASQEEVPKLIASKKDHADRLTRFTTVVQFEDATEAERKSCADVGLTLRTFAELLDNGRANPIEPEPPSPDAVATFCYTSGTTGDPKGAMLTHCNIVSDTASAVRAGVRITADDRHLSYLPLAHMFERVVQAAVWQNGGAVGFYQGSPLKLPADLVELRPTLFPSVPRLFNKFYDKIMAATSAGVKGALFKKGFEAKKFWLQRGHLEYGFWDKLVFNKVAARLGLDRCKLMLTGSAPISGHVLDFLRIVFSCHVLEGYGQTESAAAATVTPLADQATASHVGIPLACNEIRLIGVPDMAYNITDTTHGEGEAAIPCRGRGEICFRGPNVFKGYYKNAAKTAAAIDEDGWLHSGDIGIWTTQGYLKIVDRKKNIFKLSQGEYVAAEKIENVILASSYVAQAFIYGDSMQSCLVGILVPDVDYVTAWKADKAAFKDLSFEAICDNAEFKKLVFDDISRIGKAGKLHGFERAKAIHLESELWTVENEVLTPTFKLKRNFAKKKYQATIDGLYGSLGALGTVAGKKGLKQGVEESKTN